MSSTHSPIYICCTASSLHLLLCCHRCAATTCYCFVSPPPHLFLIPITKGPNLLYQGDVTVHSSLTRDHMVHSMILINPPHIIKVVVLIRVCMFVYLTCLLQWVCSHQQSKCFNFSINNACFSVKIELTLNKQESINVVYSNAHHTVGYVCGHGISNISTIIYSKKACC